MKILNKKPVNKKALEKALRKIAENKAFNEKTTEPMRLGDSGYYLSKMKSGNVKVELRDGDKYKLAFLIKSNESELYSYNN